MWDVFFSKINISGFVTQTPAFCLHYAPKVFLQKCGWEPVQQQREKEADCVSAALCTAHLCSFCWFTAIGCQWGGPGGHPLVRLPCFSQCLSQQLYHRWVPDFAVSCVLQAWVISSFQKSALCMDSAFLTLPSEGQSCHALGHLTTAALFFPREPTWRRNGWLKVDNCLFSPSMPAVQLGS